MIYLMMPCAANGQSGTAEVDTFAVWAEAYRDIRAENIILRNDLANARVDSSSALAIWQSEKSLLQFQIETLEAQFPKWYEKPGLIAVVVAVISVWATLQAVRISF